MKTPRKRNKIMATVGAALFAVTAIVPPGSNEAAAAPSGVREIGTVTIGGSVKITRKIFTTTGDFQELVDACLGANVWNGAAPGVMHLAAHRTSCREWQTGFEGLEKLKNGDTVTVTLKGKKPKTYKMFAQSTGDYNVMPEPAPIGTQLTLQASYSEFIGDTRTYLKYLTPVGIDGPATNGGRQITQGKPACVAVQGAVKNDWVFVNVTPVAAQSPGYTTVYPAGNTKIVPDPKRAPSTSTANWTSGVPSPNTTLVQAGNGGKVCAAIYGKPVHIIVDALAIAKPDKFSAAHRRLIDTRLTGQTVDRGRVCFSVPRAAGKWTVLNLTVIGRAPGWGRLETRSNTHDYSNVNFRDGDIDSNMVVIKVPSDGKLCYRGAGRSDAIVDLIAIAKNGTFRDDPALPDRAANQRKPPAFVLRINSSASGGVNNGWAIVNATPIPRGKGTAQAYDCQLHPATGSDVNYEPRVDPNVAVIKTGPNSELCIASSGPRPGWILDVLAVAEPRTFTTPPKRRIFDSRL